MKTNSLARASLVVMVFAVVVLSFASSPALGEETVAQDPVERTLPSGAKALLWPRPGSGTVLVTVAVAAGSQDEPASMGGLSHYLEHLLFDGFDDLDERGVTEAFEEISAYMNAFTREQTTVYFALTPRDAALAAAELMAGMLTRSSIGEAVYEKEKKVILEELAKDHASANGLKEEKLRQVLWSNTPLEHPVGGSIQSVTATTRPEVVEYWKDRYVPGGYRILITGDLPLGGLEKILTPFAALKGDGSAPPREDQLEWFGWGRWSAAEAPKAPGGGGGMSGMGGMGHGMPPSKKGPAGGTLALVIAAPDFLTAAGTGLDLVARWLSAPDGPINAALGPEWVQSVSAARQPREPRDLVEVRIEAAAGVEPEALLARVLGVLEAAAAGPEAAEAMSLQRAWAGERALSDQRLHYAAVFYGDALASARGKLADSVAPPKVSAEYVRAVASDLFSDSSTRIRAGWLGPGGPGEPADLPDSVAPEKAAVVSQLVDGPMGSQVATLENGLTVGILPEMGSAVFGIHLLVADRTLAEPDDAPGSADLIHRLLDGGTVLAGSSEVSRRVQRAGVEVKTADSAMIPFDNRYHVQDFSYVRMEGPASSLEGSIALLAEMVRVPAWDDEGWRNAVRSHQAERKSDNKGSEKAGQFFISALLGAEHPLAQPVSGPVDAAVADPARVREIWGIWPDGYFSPDRLVVTVASPLPADQTLEMIEDAFQGGPPAPPGRGLYPVSAPTAEPPAVEIGEAPQVTVLWGTRADVDAEDRGPLLVAMAALSDRMTAVIREREGLAYRLGAGVRQLPGGGWVLSATVGTRPENTGRVAELLDELVAGLSSEPMSGDDLTRLQARDRRTRMLRTLSAASRAYRLGRAIFEGPESPLLIDDAVFAAVTPEQVQAVVSKYLDPDAMLLVVTP